MSSSKGETSKTGGLKRINTNLSEISGHGPKSSGSGRLTLHIPNSYPRGLSPRSSRNGTPVSSRPASPAPNQQQQAQTQSQQQTAPSAFGALKGAQPTWSLDGNGQASTPSTAKSAAAQVARGKAANRNSRWSNQTPKIRIFRRDSSLITVHHHFSDSDDDHEAFRNAPHEVVPQSPHSPRHRASVDSTTSIQPSSTFFGRALRRLRRVTAFFSVKETSSSSARDFLARERNVFVWLRLSCLLAILSASLILQLQLPNNARSSSHNGPNRRPPRRKRRQDEPPVDWDNLPLSSKVFALIFFILSLLSLGTGLMDYLTAERELEKEQVDFDETEGVFLNDAHTSAFVHGVMLVVGAGIVASALWLIAD